MLKNKIAYSISLLRRAERAVKKSIQYLIKTTGYGNRYNATADEIFGWWVSNKSYDEYFENLRKQYLIQY